jgi:hypothetical protein
MGRRDRGSIGTARPALVRCLVFLLLLASIATGSVMGCGTGDDSNATLASTSQPGADATTPPLGDDASTVDESGDDGAADAEPSDAGNPSAVFAVTPLDIGNIGCGAMGSATLSIMNNGTGPLAVNAATTGSTFAVSPAGLLIQPGTSGTLTVAANVPGSSVAGSALTGSLDLFTNDPANVSVAIPLTVTPTGATVVVAAGSPTPVAFPSTEAATPAAPIAVSLVNIGNAPASVAIGDPVDPEFSFTGTGTDGGAASLFAHASMLVTANFTPAATTVSTASTSAPVTVTGTTCGTSVSSIALNGAVGHGVITGWPTAPIDFGPADCGGSAPQFQIVTLMNTGTVDATITSATFTGSAGWGSFAQGTLIPAGKSAGFAIHAPAVPTPSPTTPITATLTIHTDAETTAHTITVTEEPRGAILAFNTSATPNFGSFGSIVLLQAVSQNFSVTNTGTGSASVSLSAAATTGGSSGMPAFVVTNPAFTIPAGGTQTDAVTFSPTTPRNTAEIAMNVTSGAVCAALPLPLPLTGAGIGGGPTVNPTSLGFLASCGRGAPASQTITVANRGNANMNWSMSGVTGAGSSQYTVSASPPPGLLMPNQSSTVTVSAAAVPSPALSTSPSAYAAQLAITTDVPFDSPHVVTLGETPLGDQLSFSASNFTFGQFPINTSTIAQSFTVTNNGNPSSGAANVSLSVGGTGASAYSLTPGSISNLAPGGGVSSFENLMFRPTSTIAYPATVSLVTSDPLCTALPSPIQLIGTGTQGKVSVSATTIAFGTDGNDPGGMVNCGATGLAHTFTVSNTGNQLFNITALALGQGANSAYVLSGDATTLPFTVPIGGSASITVTPKAIPAAVANPNDASPFTDTLTVTTDALLDSPHKVSLLMQARGAVISNTPLATSWNFGTLGNGLIGTFTSTITNTGNATASVAFQGLKNPTVFGLQNAPTIVTANGVTDVVGQFTPPQTDQVWTDQGTLVVTATQAFCEPLPTTWNNPTIMLSGSSIAGSLPVTVVGNLAFPETNCGSAAPAAQSITLTNTTNIAYQFTAQLNSGAFYTLQNPAIGDASAGIIPGNGVVVIGVTPQTVTPGQTAVAGSMPYADDLIVTFQTNPVSGVTIPISWTLNGAMLSLPEGLGPDKDSSGNQFYTADSLSGLTLPMNNSGTAAASVQFGIQPTGAFSFSPTPPISVQPNIEALPRLTSASTDATCPSLTPGSVTFLYSGPVCRPFPFNQVTIQSCVGTF